MPLQTMEKLGLPVQVFVDPITGDVPSNTRANGLMWSDIVWMYQATDPLMRRNISVISKCNAVEQNGQVFLPANFVIDSDDNLFNVHHLNPAFRRLGVHRPDGTILSPGDTITCENDEGKVTLEWKDGVNGFNISENIERLENFRSLCQAAKYMTTSTPRCEQYLKEEMGKEVETFVNYNSVRFDHYDDVALAPHKEIRIMWQGSDTHYDDLFRIRKALQNVIKKYPEAKLIMWGLHSPALLGDIPPERIKLIPWLPYDTYHVKLVTVGPDINICPLTPTQFNNSRSAIKWYEASLLHDPAATIAQRAGAYQDEIEHGKTGLLFDTPNEFEEQLCTLIENEKQRRELASNAKDWVHENRDAFKVVPKLYEWFQQIRVKKRASTPIEVVPNEPFPAIDPNVHSRPAKSRARSVARKRRGNARPRRRRNPASL